MSNKGQKKRRAITKKEGTKIVIDPSLPLLIEVIFILTYYLRFCKVVGSLYPRRHEDMCVRAGSGKQPKIRSIIL
jgi:hypothetical protein